MLDLVRQLYYAQTNFDIVGRRRLFYLVSAVAVAASLLALGVLGLQLSIDFKGGTAWKLSYGAALEGFRASPVDIAAGGSPQTTQAPGAVPGSGQASDGELATRNDTGPGTASTGAGENSSPLRRGATPSVGEIRAAVAAAGVEAEKILFLGASQVEVQSAPVDAETARKVAEALAGVVGVPPERASEVVGITSVSATWGAQISRKALRALAVFLVAVAVYISVRFQWRMALAAMVALAHDIILTVGTYAITRFTVTPATVIATLTILGYSLYDDVVVFDRVKESQIALRTTKQSYAELVNSSLNRVLMRSLNTSLTSLLPVSALLVAGVALGVPTLKDFALALFVGIAAGTYSSIFVATPLLVTLGTESTRTVGLQGAKERALSKARALEYTRDDKLASVGAEARSKRPARSVQVSGSAPAAPGGGAMSGRSETGAAEGDSVEDELDVAAGTNVVEASGTGTAGVSAGGKGSTSKGSTKARHGRGPKSGKSKKGKSSKKRR